MNPLPPRGVYDLKYHKHWELKYEKSLTMKLVIFNSYWCDEHSLYGFAIFLEEEWEKISKDYSSTEEREWYFGSNQFIYASDKEFLESFDVQDLSLFGYQFLFNTFKLQKHRPKFGPSYLCKWGHFPLPKGY